MSDTRRALAIVPTDLGAAAMEALGPLVGVVDVCTDVSTGLDHAQDHPYAVVVVAEGLDDDLSGLCGELRLHLPRSSTLVVVAHPGEGLLGLLGDTVDDVVRPPMDPAELRHRTAHRMRLRIAHYRAGSADRDELRARCLRLVGHDLNNPLTAIRILAEMMVNDFQDPELRHDAEDMLEAADLSAAIIESLSGMMRLEGGDEEPTSFPLDMADLVREVVARPFLRNHVRLLLPDGPVMVRGDRRSLGRALADVFLLAQRLCDGKGRFDIRVRQADEFIEVRVQHEAMVLPPEKDSLFTLYGTVPLRQERVPVTAAGLAYAASVAETHGGEVRFDPGPGSAVAITLSVSAT